jgi:twinkle protein
MKTWEELGIDTRGKSTGQVKTTCPRCSAYRKKKTYPCLSLDLDTGLYNCWHCAWAGSLKRGEDAQSNPRATPVVFRKPVYRMTPLPQRVLAWFASRGIPETILARRHISYGPVYMPQLEQEVPAIQFPYFRNGEVINCKYRDGHKYFRMVGGAERILYGLDDIQGDTLLICEGEMDAMALEVAGFASVVSVPDGAPAVATKNYESKFDFLLSAEAQLTPLTRIVLAVDTDAPGQKLAEELARRLGPERCYRVTWSSDCKDANEVLMSYGADVLRECIGQAQPWPVSGVVTVEMLSQAIDHIYEHGMPRGVSPGWSSLARYYTVRPGEVTVVTGIPSHGKSFVISAITVELARLHGWQIAHFSPENYPLERFSALLMEQYTGLPFDGHPSRMSRQTLAEAKQWLAAHMSFLMPDDAAPTIAHLLDLAKIQVYRQGITGLVLDPWNEIEHSRPTHQSETEYISHALSQIRRFARLHAVHIWVVAHPTKLHKAEKGEYAGQYPPPTPYDVAGSAHFRNKADNCLTIWRDVEANDNRVQIHIQKVRFREIGKTGGVTLIYEPLCGRLHEPTVEDQAWHTQRAS